MPLNGKVLVLNQNYEPLVICHVKRAIVLIFLEKAHMVETFNGVQIRSVSTSFPRPSIIRLIRYIHRQRRGVLLSKKNILRRDRHICGYCGIHTPPMTLDHIIPKVKGGKDSWENLVSACTACNNKKGNKTPEEANMPLLFNPRKPHYLSFILQQVGAVDESWKPYLFMS